MIEPASRSLSVPRVVAARAGEAPDLPALVAAGRPPLDYRLLSEHVLRVAAGLRSQGVERKDRVALVLRNGPEAASAFLVVSATAVCAPLNPDYREAELDFYLQDLGARLVLVGADIESPVRDVSRRLGVDVLELRVDEGAPAGVFQLDGIDGPHHESMEPAAEDDVALVLHTSGTTARPKVVPLTHRSLCLSARSVAETLALSSDDRCLNVMPLFHIHGLVAGLLASLYAGGSVACAPGFHPRRFFELLVEQAPSWYTAVPAMHQAVLERATQAPELVRSHRLRFVRSSSAALPPSVGDGLEHLLEVPVIEAYGMTEAAHQIASNPLPPGTRKPGSVGLAAGPDVALRGADGATVGAGEVGEVVIRGGGVFSGYESNDDANADAFLDGWFRTGDEGILDEDGYLFLRGRIKEIINRGGEKVGPLEIDAVLTAHPAVAQAVTFGIPDSRLGEEVAAAVVIEPGADVDERGLQDFAVHRLAPFKVPRKVVFVDEIPKGPTGKVQRLGLAERLGVGPLVPGGAGGDLRPRSAVENELEKIWADVLGVPSVGVRDDFFALGGDSILGAEAVARTRALMGAPDLPLISIVRAPTVEAMAKELERPGVAGVSGVVPLRVGGSRVPLFFVHGLDGDVVGFAALAARLSPEQPLYGLRAPGIDVPGSTPDRIEGLADVYLDDIRRVQPDGPYVLGGFCMGAGVAIELAHRLAENGDDVALLVLVDPRLRALLKPVDRWRRRVRGAARSRLRPTAGIAVQMEPLARARDAYRAEPISVPTAIFLSPGYGDGEHSDEVERALPNIVTSTPVPGSHGRRFHTGHVDELAKAIDPVLAGAAPPGSLA